MFENIGRVKEYKDGAVIFSENQAGRSMYVIESGHVRLTRTNIRESEQIVSELATIGPGAFFGEMAVFDSGPRSATATAVGPVRLREISRKDLEAEISNSPAVALFLLEKMSARIRTTDAKIEQLMVREQLAEGVWAQVCELRYPDCLIPPP